MMLMWQLWYLLDAAVKSRVFGQYVKLELIVAKLGAVSKVGRPDGGQDGIVDEPS